MIRKFQVGGPAPMEGAPEEMPQEGAPMEGAPVEGAPEGGAPMAGGEQDPIMQLAQLAQQALQNQDCEAAMAVCEGFLQLLAQASQQQAPAESPTFQRRGGRMSRI